MVRQLCYHISALKPFREQNPSTFAIFSAVKLSNGEKIVSCTIIVLQHHEENKNNTREMRVKHARRCPSVKLLSAKLRECSFPAS